MRPRGGLIASTLPPVSIASACGVFTLREAQEFRALGTWPRGPSAPTGLAATASNSQLTLSWTAPTTTHGTITNYLVEYTPAGGSASYVLAGSTSTSYTLTGLTNNTAHTLRVAAVNHTAGDWSLSVTATPGVPTDPFFSNVALLLHMDGANGSTTFTDSSQWSVPVLPTDVVITTEQSKFGSSSAYFAGSSDNRLAVTSNNFNFGNDDFTIEWWLNSTATNAYAAMMSRYYDGPGGILFSLNGAIGNGRPEIYWREFENAPFIISDTGNFNDGSWHHYAFVRNGTTCHMYIDGISRGFRTGVSTAVPASTIFIGSDAQFYGREFTGYIDELRITKGVARYTANFTPPTAPFPDA